MLAAFALLLACQLAGEAINRLTGLPLPGAVIGLFLLWLWLGIRRGEPLALDRLSGWLLANLSIMFVPAAVGLIQQGAILSRYGLALGLATACSTILTLVVTVLVFKLASAGERDRA